MSNLLQPPSWAMQQANDFFDGVNRNKVSDSKLIKYAWQLVKKEEG